MSSLLYGCESWLEGDVSPVNKLYHMCLKHLLGVRSNTTNNLCRVELGYPPLKAIVRSKQRKFIKNMWHERKDMTDDPFSLATSIVLENRFCTAKYLRDMIFEQQDDIGMALENIKSKISTSVESSRCVYYKVINPELTVNNVYSNKGNINEIERISFTKMRFGAHSLAIETGRWNRRGRGRLPIEQHLCSCRELSSHK